MGSGCWSCRARRHPAFPGSYPCRSWGYGKLFRVALFARLATRVSYADGDLKAVAEAACCTELVAWLSRLGWASVVPPRTCLGWRPTVSGCGSRRHGVSSWSCLTCRGHRLDLSPHAGITRDGCTGSGQCQPGMFPGLASRQGFPVPRPPRRDRGDGRQHARPEPRLSAGPEAAQSRMTVLEPSSAWCPAARLRRPDNSAGHLPKRSQEEPLTGPALIRPARGRHIGPRNQGDVITGHEPRSYGARLRARAAGLP